MIKNNLPETDLTLHDFHYDLPEELIAQTPVYPRDSSRLMVIDREGDGLDHRHFSDILDYIRPEDVLVVNETRVIPARSDYDPGGDAGSGWHPGYRQLYRDCTCHRGTAE